MTVSRRQALVLVGAAVALAGCESAPLPTFPEITFAHREPIRLDVASVEYVPAYKPPLTYPNVEHLMPVRPAAVMERWVRERLKAVGVSRRAVATLLDASVVEVPLETTAGITGLFTDEQSRRYDGRLEMRVEIFADDGTRLGVADAVATRSRTVPEDITLVERDQVWYHLVEAMANDLDRELERVIRKYLAVWVR